MADASLNSGSSDGRKLPPAVSRRLDATFPGAFGDVRLFDSGRAADAADRLRAEAFTIGTHIHFSRGAYRPATAAGAGLLAHELGHVLQQRRGGPAIDRRLKSDADYAQAHDDGDWLEDDMGHWRRDFDTYPVSGNSFIRAAEFNTKNAHPDEYKTINERSEYYFVMNFLGDKSGGAVGQSRFFAAAGLVTSAFHEGIGVVEAPSGWALHSAEAIALLKEVNGCCSKPT